MLVDVFDQSMDHQFRLKRSASRWHLPLMHEQHVGSARDVWVTCNGEDTDFAWIGIVRKLAIKVVEVISPDVLDIPGVYPSMTVGAVLDEHHRWQIVDVPATRNFHETGLGTSYQRFLSEASTYWHRRETWNGHTQSRNSASARHPHDLSPTKEPHCHVEVCHRSLLAACGFCPGHRAAAPASCLMDSRGSNLLLS
jgi:hypothetical protein